MAGIMVRKQIYSLLNWQNQTQVISIGVKPIPTIRQILLISFISFLEHKSDLWQLDHTSLSWKQVKPRGKGPEPRRRQALCQVVSNRIPEGMIRRE